MIGIHPDIERVLISETEIQTQVSQLAARLSTDYADDGQLIVIGILKGAFIFLADLTRRLTVPHRVDFMALSSYGQTTTTTGAVRIIMDLRVAIEGRHVLVVEDIIDSGYTLHYLLEVLRTRNPASLRSCVLLSKPDRRRVDVRVDYLGFEIPDVWVVGYGLDYAELHRTLPYIGALKPEVYR
jgi:hypoxanthine phosphoribosyltransferase